MNPLRLDPAPQALAAEPPHLNAYQLLDVPVAWIATDTRGYRGLNVFGLASASMSYETFSTAHLELTIKGLI